MFFFPEQSDPSTCQDVADEMNSKFPQGYGIDVSYRRDTSIETGQVIEASKGVLHYGWAGKYLYFWPDETVTEINAKFKTGYRFRVEYLNAVDYHQVQVSPAAASCWNLVRSYLLLHIPKETQEKVS